MKRIAVATDFSTRSDRALRRATLLARDSGAELVLLHAVDDDQAVTMAQAQQRQASELLAELCATSRSVDGVDCSFRVVDGEAFLAIGAGVEAAEADLLVMGPHRRQALRDVFAGTTVERTIRFSRHPVIMANGVPAGSYRRILVATDLSDGSARAIAEAGRLGVFDRCEVLALYVYSAPAQTMMLRSSGMTTDQLKAYIAEERDRAATDLAAFVARIGFAPTRQLVELADVVPAATIHDCARVEDADLVVLGTSGRGGAARFLLGSVAEEVLRRATVDVLVVPSPSDEPGQ